MIYHKDVDFFLNCFSTTLPEIEAIWKENGGFVGPDRLAQEIVKRKGFNPGATQILADIAVGCFPKDFRSGAFERQNFFYGLADYYAEISQEECSLVEFDIGNCNGAGDFFGDDNLLKIIRYMRAQFEQGLKAEGATFVQAFDNAKNDDLKLVVTGLSSEELAEALVKIQNQLLKKFIFAATIPHSKYSDESRSGIGVGSGFVNLGRNRSPQVLQERLNLFVEKRKLEDAELRYDIRKEVGGEALEKDAMFGCLSWVFNAESCIESQPKVKFPFAKDGFTSIADPFVAREAICNQLAKDSQMTEEEANVFKGLLKFYHSSEALTGARRDNFLFEDIKWVEDHSRPVTILNVKVENCAGMNKVLSHIHSAEMTKHFVEIVSDFTSRNFGPESASLVYYIGRNSFIIVLPGVDKDGAKEVFENYLQEQVDREINDQPMGTYFTRFGLDVPADLADKKVGTIPNLRGLGPGVLAINVQTAYADEFADERTLVQYQNRCISSNRAAIASSVLNLPNDITYHELERNKTPHQLLEALRGMVHEIIEREKCEDGTAKGKPASGPSAPVLAA